MTHKNKLTPQQLRWHCDPEKFDFQTTKNLPKVGDIVGQDVALKALNFALMTRAHGQNVFVRGLTGTGRMTAVMQLLDELSPQIDPSERHELCYVHNFVQADKPQLLQLPANSVKRFKRLMASLIDFMRTEVPNILDSEESQALQSELQDSVQAQLDAISLPFKTELAEKQMTLLPINQGDSVQQIIVPFLEGKAVSPSEYQSLVERQIISPEMQAHFKETHTYFVKELKKLNREAYQLHQEHSEKMFEHGERLVRYALDSFIYPIMSQFPHPSVGNFLQQIENDVVAHVLSGKLHEIDFEVRYGVNVVLEQNEDTKAAVVLEHSPSIINLMGSVEPLWEGQAPKSDYRGVRGGAILRAHGGFLILDAQEVLVEPGAWHSLMRTIKTGKLEIVPKEFGMYMPHMVIKPEPINTRLRVIMLGDANTYYQLRMLDPDFVENFKVLADFDLEMEHTPQALSQYVRVVAYVVDKENLPEFSADAVAGLCEYGVRQAGHRSKLSTRFGGISDLVRESAFLARQMQATEVSREHVNSAIDRMHQRNMLPSHKFLELINRGTVIIQTQGEIVGQINGLAVMSSGDLAFGFPARITATIGAGHAGIIDIEGRASMSGSIHTKGVNILAGLLRHILQLDHPLAFSASLAFEQSYGGIDGDSASAAETCCLLSALTGVPIKQHLAMTGAIDQLGHVQAIGGANEKIEGFFDVCAHVGLTGEQGVIIPAANIESLMLREDIVEAVKQSHFHVYAVSTIHEALAVVTGVEVGTRNAEGVYPEGSLLSMAQHKATEFWRGTLKSPDLIDSAI